MKERPIIFNSEMVRAILDGRKTQTRRVIKPPRWAMAGDMECDGTSPPWAMVQDEYGDPCPVVCPYGKPGDRLWVREAIRCGPPQLDGRSSAVYECDTTYAPCYSWGWKRPYLPPRYMPYGMCRIKLEITDIRVERVQDISEADARAEGVEQMAECRGSWSYAFAHLWNSIEADRGYSCWASNPWVWVVQFKRIEP